MDYYSGVGSRSLSSAELEAPIQVGAGASVGILDLAPRKQDRTGLSDPIAPLGAINLKGKPSIGLQSERSRNAAENQSTSYPGGADSVAIGIQEKDIILQPRNAPGYCEEKVAIRGFSSLSGMNFAQFSTASGTPNLSRLEMTLNFAGVALSPYTFNSTGQNLAGFAIQATGTTTILNTGSKEIRPGDQLIWRLPEPGEYPVRAQPGQPPNKIYPVIEPISATAVQEQLGLAYDTMMNKGFDGVYNTPFTSLLPNTCSTNSLTTEQEWALGKEFGILNNVIRGIEALAVRGVVKVLTPKEKLMDDLGKILVQQMLGTKAQDPDAAAMQIPAEAERIFDRLPLPNSQKTNVAANKGMTYFDQTDTGVERVSDMETMMYKFFKDEMDEPPELRNIEKTKTAEAMLWLASRLGAINDNKNLNEVWKKDVIDSVLVKFVASKTLAELHMLSGPMDIGIMKYQTPRDKLIREYRTMSIFAPAIEMNAQNTGINSFKRRIVGTAISGSAPSTRVDIVMGFDNKQFM